MLPWVITIMPVGKGHKVFDADCRVDVAWLDD
jgi:hypothetical protein